MFTGRQKILARYRVVPRRHGRRHDADRRPAPLGRRAGHRRASSISPTPHHRHPAAAGSRSTQALSATRGRHPATRAPQTIAAIIVETVIGTNGILIPPDGYLQGLRDICDRHGILLIADEVMAGFGRTGRWFAIDHWKVVPDIITMAKGLTSALRAARGRRHAPAHRRPLPGPRLLRRPHLQLPPAGLRRRRSPRSPSTKRTASSTRAAAWAGDGRCSASSKRSHPSVGATRNLGLFGIVELVRNRKTRSRWRPSTARPTR